MSTPVLAAVVVLAVAFETFCLVDLCRAGEVSYVPKWAWAGICVITIPLGGIAYLAVGRSRHP